MINFPTPHKLKLEALLKNPRLPEVDRENVKEAEKRYIEWIASLEAVNRGAEDAVKELVDATNTYKRYIELDLIFDSADNFLYRQKGQLKLDNTIIEEFLPYLVYKGIKEIDDEFDFGPHKSFAGLSFDSSVGDTGDGGDPVIRTKDQDFILGKKLFIKTSFNRDFKSNDFIESHLGYVCAECKTNLDKTMFQEASATSRDLKIAVPNSLYFLVAEYLDMKPTSIITTQIDDVLIVRKAKRMTATQRQEYRSPELRRKHRTEYVEFIDTHPYDEDLFSRIVTKIKNLIDDAAPFEDTVLKKGHF